MAGIGCPQPIERVPDFISKKQFYREIIEQFSDAAQMCLVDDQPCTNFWMPLYWSIVENFCNIYEQQYDSTLYL